jgi:hypothetical protein
MRARAEDTGEVKHDEDHDDDHDDDGHQQAAIAAVGLGIIVVLGKAWHRAAPWFQLTSRRSVVINPAAVAAVA